MNKPHVPKYEDDRLCALNSLNLLDTDPEDRFDSITKEATRIFSVPISTITLVDKDREWFKSVQGLNNKENPRDISFCSHALNNKVMMIIEDTLVNNDFANNPMVVGYPHIRFYAGKSLNDRKSGLPVGVFCIKDTKPRKMSLNEINSFLELAAKAEDELNKSV